MPDITACLRVSTMDQKLVKNKAEILCLAHSLEPTPVHFVEEKVTGKVAWRNRKIAEILDPFLAGES